MAAKKKAAKKKAAAKTATDKPKKAKFGSDLRIVGVNDNPRREGTGGHAKYKEMAAFMKKKPDATVADVIAGTSYKAADFNWDREREHIKVK